MVTIALVVQLLLLSTLAVRAIAEPAGFTANPGPIDATDLPLTIESGLPTAQAVAQEWISDAQLMSVSMQVDWPLSVDAQSPISVAPGGWIAYTYFARAGSSTGISKTLSLFFERTSGVLVQEREVDWSLNEQAIALDPQSIRVRSTTALMTVEAREGLAWRAGCPTERHVSRISLTAAEASKPTWVVTYRDARLDTHGLVARIDANSGEITAYEDRSDPCSV